MQVLPEFSDTHEFRPLRSGTELPPPLNYLQQNLTTDSDFVRCVAIMRHQWRTAVLFAAVVLTIVTIVTLASTPIYESTARLEIDPPGTETFNLATDSSGSIDLDYLETQSEILKSDGLSTGVIRQLRLDLNPAVVGQRHLVSSPATPQSRTRQLSHAENIALRYFKNHLSISPVRKSRVLEVSFGSPDPHLSAAVVNSLVDLFIEQNYKTRYDAIMNASEWLSRQMTDIREKANTSSEALTTFQKEHGIFDVDGQQSSVSRRIAELSQELTQAESDRIQLEAYLKIIKQGSDESLPQIRDNSMMQTLTQHLIESKAQLSQAQTIYGDKSLNVQQLERHVNELQNQILSEERKTIQEIQAKYEAARARESLMSSEIKSASGEMSQMAEYSSLKREAQTDGDLYNTLYERIKEAGIAAASKSSNIRIVDLARELDIPTHPRRGLNIGVGLLLGMLGGLVLAFAREGLDNSVRTQEDVKRLTGLPALTLVPTAKTLQDKLRTKQGTITGVSFFEQPLSAEAEAVRGLRASILLSNLVRPPRVLLVASALPQEGKTTVAINLAIALSRVGTTCLVDTDMRKPGLARVLQLGGTRGLSDVLAGQLSLQDALVGVHFSPRLAILPAGSTAQTVDSLFHQQVLRTMLETLKDTFQYIVIDSPPLIPYADGRVISSIVDGVILVGRCGSTKRQSLAQCAEMLDTLHAPLLGVVLNRVDLTSAEYEYYQSA
jgi:succinoglycan biosynthesis transport protein ExoP